MSRWGDRSNSLGEGDNQYNNPSSSNQNEYTNSLNTNTKRYNNAQAENCATNIGFLTLESVEAQYFTNSNRNHFENSQEFSLPNTSNVPVVDISNSRLTATAKEFKPSNSGNINTGAVRKQSNYKKNYSENYQKNKNTYQNSNIGRGTNRDTKKQTPNNYKKSHTRTTQQNKVLSDVAQFLNHTKENETTSNEIKEATPKSKDNLSRKVHEYYNKKDNYYKPNYNRRGYYNNFEDKNWRKQTDANVQHHKEKKTHNKSIEAKNKLDAASQRERLEEMLVKCTLECLVCCERLRHADFIWSCIQCYHIIHLHCVVKWAKTSKLESGWRCPACQNVYSEIPKDYRCFCNKFVNPLSEQGILPHSCGEPCKKRGRNCQHTCTLLCHPGPCPDCNIMVPRLCGCGSTKPLVKCSSDVTVTCQNVCNKLLDCQLHTCENTCHNGTCKPCVEFLKQECYCGKVGRRMTCTKETNGSLKYSCGEVCEKILMCGNHKCMKLCHEGNCEPCLFTAEKIKTCPCGQTLLTEKRTSCLDPIPSCDKICSKALKCGQPSTPHLCKSLCHSGPCPACPSSTFIRCRCGHMYREIDCMNLKSKADDARCEKKCTKKRLCAKHKCNQLCCIEIEHACPLPCNRLLSCGQHRCEETCHKGRCPPCWRTSFQELYCECGSNVLYPPVACGTRPPPCNKPCSRIRPCGHEVHHNCHTGPCPPCTIFCKRWCHGKHESRATIPCHQADFSCGIPCGKEMCCKRHKCVQPCHAGVCPTPCNQPCMELREACGHPCNQPCHEPPCPETPCKQTVKVTCDCGLRSSNRICMELSGEYQSIALSHLASKMAEIQRGQTVDISDIVVNQKKSALKTLECNDECRIVERNRRLAIGLQIRNPDLSAKLTPRYSDYMRNWAKRDSRFCQHVHDKLTELVQLAKQSKQKSRAYSFESMNRDKRHFVHEYCQHFGCDSAAYDHEPNRNVVATALRDKSWLPSVSLLELIQRENGQRKVPGPVLSKAGSSRSETVSLRLPGKPVRPATPPGEYVDYFDDPPI